MSSKKKVRRRVGDVVAIPLGDGSYGFGRVLRTPLVAFYDLRKSNISELQDVLCAPVAFIVAVMKYALNDGDWPVIGYAPLEEALMKEPLFFKKDGISGSLSIYRDSSGVFTPASREQCEGLECAAVWDRCHLVDRLIDHFAGRPNKWVESMRP